jgi:hypothetical protein
MLATDWQEAAKINVLLCFMPIPYGSHGYLFALSDVPFFQFVGVFALVRALVIDQTATTPIYPGFFPAPPPDNVSPRAERLTNAQTCRVCCQTRA